MKKLKDPTVPTACQLSQSMRQKVEEMADLLELSISQCVAMLIEMGFNNESFNDVQNNIEELNILLLKKEQELDEVKALTGFNSPFLSKSLKVIRFNNQILEKLFDRYGDKPVPRTEFDNLNFNFNIIFEAQVKDKKPYFFMDNYGWANYDQTKTHLLILKR